MARVRQHVERPGRLGADAEPDGAQARDHRAAPLVEDRAEPPAVLARFAQRREAGPLHELVGRDEEVAVERLQCSDMVARGDHPPESPSRHRVRLGEPVEHERAVRELEDRAVPALVAEPVIDLVGDDERPAPAAQLADGGHALGRQHGAGGIGGRIDHDRSGPRADPALDRFGSILKAVLLRHADVDRLSLGVADEVRIARIVGIAQDDLVPGIQQMPEEQQHGRRGAGRDENLIRRDRHAVRARVVLRDRFPQRQDSEAVRVPCTAVPDRAREGVTNDRRRLEVGLAELEVDHVDASPLELLGPLGHLDRQKWLDVLDPPRERHDRLRVTLLRALRICQSIPGPCRRTRTLLPA